MAPVLANMPDSGVDPELKRFAPQPVLLDTVELSRPSNNPDLVGAPSCPKMPAGLGSSALFSRLSKRPAFFSSTFSPASFLKKLSLFESPNSEEPPVAAVPAKKLFDCGGAIPAKNDLGLSSCVLVVSAAFGSAFAFSGDFFGSSLLLANRVSSQ